jgi:hypothetical protein
LAEAVFEPCAGAEAEFGARDVETSTGLAVRLRGVPDDAAAEPGERRDLLHQIADGDLPAAAEVDRFGFVIAFGGAHDGLGAVFDIRNSRVGEPSPQQTISEWPSSTASAHWRTIA